VNRSTRPNLGVALLFFAAFAVCSYFTFAAVQGDFGLFKRVEYQVQADTLELELAALQAQIDEMENLTRRLSDDYLDLDLLDQQARDVLGMIRPDEIVIN